MISVLAAVAVLSAMSSFMPDRCTCFAKACWLDFSIYKQSIHMQSTSISINNIYTCRAAASRLADRKEDAAYIPTTEVMTQKPSLQKQTSSSRRNTGDADHSTKAAHFLLKNPKASVSMLKRSPSSQKTVAGSGEEESNPANTPVRGEIGASPFEYNQGGFSNEPILGGDESPTRNPLMRFPASPRLETLASASSGELSTSSSRALLGNCQGSS